MNKPSAHNFWEIEYRRRNAELRDIFYFPPNKHPIYLSPDEIILVLSKGSSPDEKAAYPTVRIPPKKPETYSEKGGNWSAETGIETRTIDIFFPCNKDVFLREMSELHDLAIDSLRANRNIANGGDWPVPSCIPVKHRKLAGEAKRAAGLWMFDWLGEHRGRSATEAAKALMEKHAAALERLGLANIGEKSCISLLARTRKMVKEGKVLPIS